MSRRWKLLSATVIGVVAASIAFTSLAAGSTEATKVQVRMAPAPTGYKLTVSPSAVKAGRVTFAVSNTTKKSGGSGMSFVLLKTNLAPDELPTTQGGRFVKETGRVGTVVSINPGETATITLNLKPGKYVAISNANWNYDYGAYAALKVTG